MRKGGGGLRGGKKRWGGKERDRQIDRQIDREIERERERERIEEAFNGGIFLTKFSKL